MAQTNGFKTPPQSPSVSMGSSNRRSTYMTSSSFSTSQSYSSGSQQSTIVRDTAMALKRKSASQLGAGISGTAEKVGFIDLVQWIRDERLQTLPHKGSKWDSVLIRALYFAERLHGFEVALEPQALDVEQAGHIGYGHLKVLLELGHENSAALEKAFTFMYRCSLAVTAVLARAEVMNLSPEIYKQLCMMYTDLLSLVVDVAVRFYKAVHGSAEASASLDMYEVFGETITTFRERRDTVTKMIWSSQNRGNDVDITALDRWLAPQDSVIAKLALDHSLLAEEMAEYTCVWFHEELAKFVKSDNTTLLLNGGSASGKTTLAAALAERLQRPIARKSYTTLFFSASGAPAQTGSLAVIQALLCQLLSTRIGDMHLYNAVARAYEQCKHTADSAKYEDLLWHALEEALRTPIEHSNDTVIIVDGLDELVDGQSGGSNLLQRLTTAVGKSKGNKLIALARNLKTQPNTSSIERSITPADTSADIRELALKKLATSHHFRTKTGKEQDTIISRIVSVADGSFTWALLTCEVLCLEKSSDDFTKAVSNFQSPKLSVDDLVHFIVTRSQATEDAKMLMSWLVHASRPLTYNEIECVYGVNISNKTKTDRPVDVHEIVTSLAPLLTARENIVSVRHGAARPSIINLLKSGKISVPVKDQHTDFFLRLLTYAKTSLPDKGEPTLDDADHSIVETTFGKFPLMEYVVRYWVLHLSQTSAFKPGKAPDTKSIPEMDKVFPSSTTMAILEWVCWDDQYPGAKEVEFHETAGQVRKQVFTEKHPAVLQSYINVATYFEMMNDVTHASTLWYTISIVGRDVLSVSHPVVVESATRFLTATQTKVTSTRSEVVTQRESILVLLISAYERTYGMQSEIVMQTRRRLVELYRHINEQEKASEVLKIIQGNVTSTETNEATQSRGVNGNMRVSLGHKKRDSVLNGYDEGIFIDDDEEEENTSLTSVGQVDTLQKQIDSHISKKEYTQAEQLYVDLLQRISLACRSTSNADWHAKKIDVFQSYASYLEKQERRTEAVSLTTSLWRDYQHSEMSYSEAIVSKLSKSASFLKSVGEYTAALAIFKHASSFYRNVRKDKSESRSLDMIEEEMVATSHQALSQTSRDVSSKSASTSESSQYEMFHVLIANKSKSMDQSTMTLAKSLTSRYVEQRNWSQAISVIESTLSRTWSSFLATSVHEVTLASSFQSESIELILQLASIYKEQRLFEKAEDIYIRLFRAALTQPKDEAFLNKAKDLLIEFYTQRGYPDKVISVYQELLAVYRRVYGPDHEKTISIMYELGSRCRNHARSHPYWIEYYQQIVSVLNKSSTTISARAMDAAVIVAQSYWEERRSSDAVALYASIWNTFVSNHKEFKMFKDEAFVRNLYERYYQSLEETTADYATLRKVTSEYRETAKAVFGAQSSLAAESTLALARVSQQSEAHMEESISLYEEASQSSARSASSSSSASYMSQAAVAATLATMYKRRVLHSSSSSSASSESVAKATSIYEGQLKEMKSKYSYSNEETLNSVRELSQLYVRQGKTEQASKELSTAVIEIAQHETSSQKMFEAAQSLVQTYQACNLTQRCVSIVDEMHYQLITKEKRSNSTFSVIESSSATISFLAAMEYQLRKDLSITLTEITASLTAESIMYRNFKQLVTSNASLDKIIIAAAPVRHLCQSWKRQPIVEAVEHECVQLFTRRDASSVQLLSKDSPRIFIIGILDHLGGRKCTDFVRSVILASNKTVKSLVDHNKFTDAHDVVKMAFMYAQYRNGYRGAKGISRGFELASYLDGRGENKCSDPQLRKKLLQLSNDIIKDILKICHEQNINIAQVSLTELNELIALLGEQQDYSTLETLLGQLWNTREAQKNWPPEVLQTIGRHLICARYLAGHPIKAVRLCEDIAYNFRRVHGVTNSATIESYELLAQLYTSTAQSYQREANSDKANAGLASEYFKKAILVHEDILRWVVSDATGGEMDDDDGEEDTAASILADHGIKTNGSANGNQSSTSGGLDSKKRSELVAKHLRLLKLAVQRLGSWPKDYSAYEHLNAQLFRVFPEALKGSEGVEKWQLKSFGSGKAESQAGSLEPSQLGSWEVLAH